MNFAGIDPGISGAASFFIENNIVSFDTPFYYIQKSGSKRREYDIQNMVKIFDFVKPEEYIIAIESVHSFPKEGPAGAFQFGKGFGIWLGILATKKIPYELITPQAWKKEFGLIGQTKEAAIQKVQQLFPSADLSDTKEQQLGRSDSILISEFIRRKYVKIRS